MNCSEVRDRIAFSAGSEGVETHVAGCAECREFLELQRQLDGKLSSFTAPRLPAAVRRSVLGQVRRESRRRTLDWILDCAPLLAGAVSAAACIALVPGSRAVVMLAGIVLAVLACVWQAAWGVRVEEDL